MANYIKNLENVSKKIISRGKVYFLADKVKDIRHEDNEYQAKVIGNDSYDVSLSLNGDKLVSYSCSCPFPALCKHVVALLYAIEDNENKKDPYEDFLKKTRSLSFNNSFEEFYGLPYKINALSNKMSKEEYISLLCLYLQEMSSNECLFQEGNIQSRFSIFFEKMKFSDDEIFSIIEKVLNSLVNNLEGSLRFFSSFLKDEKTSQLLQQYAVRKYPNKDSQLNYCLTCLSGKSLPREMSPSFVSIIARISPRLLLEKDLLNAISYYEKEDSPDEVVFLLHLLLNKGDKDSFKKKDFDYLIKAGLLSEARNIAFCLLKSNDDFSSYLTYRRLFSDKEFYGVRSQVSIAISYKKYLNSVLLFDGKEYFPDLYDSFSYRLLNPTDIFLARDLIKENKTIHILTESSHKYVENELKKKHRNKDYFYSLLYLDYLRDDSLSYYLFKDEVLLDKEDKFYKGIWLYLVERNGLLGRINFNLYKGDKLCS